MALERALDRPTGGHTRTDRVWVELDLRVDRRLLWRKLAVVAFRWFGLLSLGARVLCSCGHRLRRWLGSVLHRPSADSVEAQVDSSSPPGRKENDSGCSIRRVALARLRRAALHPSLHSPAPAVLERLVNPCHPTAVSAWTFAVEAPVRLLRSCSSTCGD